MTLFRRSAPESAQCKEVRDDAFLVAVRPNWDAEKWGSRESSSIDAEIMPVILKRMPHSSISVRCAEDLARLYAWGRTRQLSEPLSDKGVKVVVASLTTLEPIDE
jgi:hypothetical protein